MTLEQAIEHAEEVANDYEDMTNDYALDSKKLAKCAADHRQLAAWLRELVELRKAPKIVRCGECIYREIYGVDGFCDHITGEPIMVSKTDFCKWAERRTDGT